MLELSKKNGFIGLSLYPYHLKNHGKCSIEDFCLMIKQLINLIGIDHIGIGSDLCNNWPDEVVMWMRNGRWNRKIDYGESNNKDAKWPEQPSWFKKGSDFKTFFSEPEEAKIANTTLIIINVVATIAVKRVKRFPDPLVIMFPRPPPPPKPKPSLSDPWSKINITRIIASIN